MLTIENISKSYGAGVKAVDNVSLTVNQGEIFGFLGPNGAGKSTTIKMITGIISKDSGRITVDGIDIDRDPIAVKQKICYCPDNPDIPLKLKGIEFINFISDMYSVPKDIRMSRTSQYAELFEMTKDLNSRIADYSHGMRQKILLIATLVTEPKLFILDEPMVGLDPRASFNLKELMRSMCQNNGMTVFFSTHVLDVAERFCDRVAIINKGRIIAIGTLEQLREREGGASSLEEIFLELTES